MLCYVRHMGCVGGRGEAGVCMCGGWAVGPPVGCVGGAVEGQVRGGSMAGQGRGGILRAMIDRLGLGWRCGIGGRLGHM